MDTHAMRESEMDGKGSGAGLVERGRVLLALYEGGIGFLRDATAAHAGGHVGRFTQCVERAERVVNELSATLDREQGGELATMLAQLYEYMQFRLQEAVRTGSAEPLEDVIRQLGRIHDSYRQVVTGLQQTSAEAAVAGYANR